MLEKFILHSLKSSSSGQVPSFTAPFVMRSTFIKGAVEADSAHVKISSGRRCGDLAKQRPTQARLPRSWEAAQEEQQSLVWALGYCDVCAHVASCQRGERRRVTFSPRTWRIYSANPSR